MTAGEPSAARRAYRRVKSAAGVADLPGLEERIDLLEVGVAEELELQAPLADLVGRLERDLVPLLERRAARRAAREARLGDGS